jgi:formylglycine-generating enzyme required for sulfatase activity
MDGLLPAYEIYSGSNNPIAVAWHDINSESRTREVGLLAPNGLGIYDMSGNVLEWCWDWFVGYASDDKTNPTGPDDGSLRVFRGGSCLDIAQNISSFSRNFIGPSLTSVPGT